MNNSSFIISISGPSGSGKSTLVNELKKKLDEAVSFHFDDYVLSNTYPEDFSAWLKEGADPKQVLNPDFLKDLSNLANGGTIVLPHNKQELKPDKYIIVEEPFGRGREGIGELIDFAVCIDIPLEVALARRILRTLEGIQRSGSKADEPLKQMEEYLSQYLFVVRDLYHAINTRVKSDCDLIVNGIKSPELLAELIIVELKKRSLYV
ncbi:uridine kinase [Paenibacillus sp. J23TS9]|uniref:P-loop NTPase fold protein n=1 Tax=Paenibacillus sp. J23TS9 TaxID=2807193 RepID=UPI001B00D99F|nr:P-loop NTPase fold protein [Paenibacillus sp. J23TS9]GIP30527.1 uridine kinase [Paenibacillus sp. J23TS9]